MGYIDDDTMVRVDFFKPSGKWYSTEAVEWVGGYSGVSIHDAFAISLRNLHDYKVYYSEMDAVCLEPYHEHSHPIMIKCGGWNEY